MRTRLRRVAVGLCLAILLLIFGGPVASGAVFLLLPTPETNDPAPVDAHEPLHRGGVDLPTGLYIRRNDDLVVDGAPALVLRRTYRSGDRIARHLGIGTTHDAESYLTGDGKTFQWITLIMPGGVHVRFERTSPGTSFFGAMFEHRTTPGEWRGARLGWTGMHWALRRRDGSLMLFQGCAGGGTCSIVRARDQWGRITQYRRDRAGRLVRMEGSDHRWIAFDYDARDRVSRAYASNNTEVRYTYDERGRLQTVVSSDGTLRRYTYTDFDEMATMLEPGTDIENAYADGRCVRQINRYPDAEPFTFRFSYRVQNGAVVQTDSDRSNGSWVRYTWSPAMYATSETWGCNELAPAVFTYERDLRTNAVTALTVTCPDRTGRPLRHSSFVRAGFEDDVKLDVLRTHCSWTALPGGGRTWRSQ